MERSRALACFEAVTLQLWSHLPQSTCKGAHRGPAEHLQGNAGVLVLAQQFIAAVEYCHQHCVAHRDLKLDNTLLDDSNPPTIKLCDFGFAKTWTDDANMYTHIG